MTEQIRKDAEYIRANIGCLFVPTDGTKSTGSTESIQSALVRIEGKLSEVHGHTGTLVKRVPENLAVVIAELKESVLARLDSLKKLSTESNESTQSVKSDTKSDWRVKLLGRLTPQERNLFKVCFTGGLITYKELAQRLNISPVSAKNLVNQLFKDPDKRRLFHKKHIHGAAKIGVNPAVEQKILHKREKSSDSNKNPVFVFKDSDS